ncbi:efflux transporter outer membrane subunit [Sphingomonas sp. BN140010]|uniref:Efflux transporter outer membrane subunit n=1 Tax=Sphingomonas arvum TaxID=2992113 RepID=A0ABT3JCH3_9SPHN|nr:efflux transporter outer membrane subunit [Sphingomonas sp. BN140010]MCW3796496.1 efflux transporter outer membrane subunit [Sphingomonas sp. BN140010]
MTRLLLVSSAAALALAGCAAGPDYGLPRTPAPIAAERGTFARANQGEVASEPAARWWEALNDASLNALVAEGLSKAPSLKAAAARVRQARAALGEARTIGLPTAGASATAIGAHLPDGGPIQNGVLYSLGADASWEVDLWGARRRGTEQETAQVGTAQARLADAQVTLSSDIARTYVALRANQTSQALLEQQAAIDAELVQLAAQRYRAGTTPAQTVGGARATAARTAGQLAQSNAERQVLLDKLALLTGSEPGSLDARLGPASVPLPPASVAVGDPTGLLRRRPDIRIAERQLASATAQVGIDVAKQFPKVSFMGLIGLGGSGPTDAFDPSNLTALALPRINWSFLDFGRNKARVRGSEAARDAAEAEYRQQVLAALQDAEASLTRFGSRRIELAQASTSSGHVGSVARLQAQRARAGTIAQADALEARRRQFDAELAEVEARSALTISYIDLSKALGLGWRT